jgi:DNA repair exonuclease SbcCD ATPase subunit
MTKETLHKAYQFEQDINHNESRLNEVRNDNLMFCITAVDKESEDYAEIKSILYQYFKTKIENAENELSKL